MGHATATALPCPAADRLRGADHVLRRRLARQLLSAQAEYLERCYLTPAEVAQVLADLAASWGREHGERVAADVADAWAPPA